MGSLTAGTGLLVACVVALLVLLCAAMGVNAWLRLRRLDRTDEADRTGAEPQPPPAFRAAAAPEPPPPPAGEDLPHDPAYQGPGDWDGGPADPPEFRIQSE